MPRRGPRRITVTAIGTPPPLTPSILRPLAMEILHRLEAKQAAERQGSAGAAGESVLEGDAAIRRALISINRLDSGSSRPATVTVRPIR